MVFINFSKFFGKNFIKTLDKFINAVYNIARKVKKRKRQHNTRNQKGVVLMSKKVETVYTSRKMNNAAHEKRKAARMATRIASEFDRQAREMANQNVCYVNVNGITMPVSRA